MKSKCDRPAFSAVFPAARRFAAPGLLVILNPQLSTLIVFWPSSAADWVRPQNTNSVSSVNWSKVTITIQDDSTTKTLLVNPPNGNRFYGLAEANSDSRPISANLRTKAKI